MSRVRAGAGVGNAMDLLIVGTSSGASIDGGSGGRQRKRTRKDGQAEDESVGTEMEQEGTVAANNKKAKKKGDEEATDNEIPSAPAAPSNNQPSPTNDAASSTSASTTTASAPSTVSTTIESNVQVATQSQTPASASVPSTATATFAPTLTQVENSESLFNHYMDQIDSLPLSSSDDGKSLIACPFENCGEKFSKRFSLKRHLKRHTGVKPYKCEFPDCRHAFAERSTLKRHERTHTNDRPYKCDFCAFVTADRTNVRRHMVHHTTMQKPWICPKDTCRKGFTRRAVLRKHIQTRHPEDAAMVEKILPKTRANGPEVLKPAFTFADIIAGKAGLTETGNNPPAASTSSTASSTSSSSSSVPSFTVTYPIIHQPPSSLSVPFVPSTLTNSANAPRIVPPATNPPPPLYPPSSLPSVPSTVTTNASAAALLQIGQGARPQPPPPTTLPPPSLVPPTLPMMNTNPPIPFPPSQPPKVL